MGGGAEVKHKSLRIPSPNGDLKAGYPENGARVSPTPPQPSVKRKEATNHFFKQPFLFSRGFSFGPQSKHFREAPKLCLNSSTLS